MANGITPLLYSLDQGELHNQYIVLIQSTKKCVTSTSRFCALENESRRCKASAIKVLIDGGGSDDSLIDCFRRCDVWVCV